MHILLLTATVLLPFGYDAGDELFVQGHRHFTDPVSLLCQFYGVDEDTLFVRLHSYFLSSCSIPHSNDT